MNGTNGNSVRQWRCAVCKHFAGTKQKPRRTPKMPSRFDDCETNGDSLKVKDNAPCPSCSLCPHRGGAMSQMDSVSDPSKWVHEVCRIWSGAATENKPKKRSPLSTVCALCGIGGDGLTRCAARGCCVAFHPMCAVIASRMGTAEDSRDDKKRQRSSLELYGKVNLGNLCPSVFLKTIFRKEGVAVAFVPLVVQLFHG